MVRVAKALVYDNDGYALVLRRSSTHPYYAHEADLPGGVVERNETYIAGLVRELREEVGIDIPEESLQLIVQESHFVYGKKHLYEVRLAHRPPVTISWEHESYEWIAPAQLYTILESHDPYVRFVRETLGSKPS